MRIPTWLLLALTVLLLLPAACGASAPEADPADLPEAGEESAGGETAGEEGVEAVIEATADPFDLGGREVLVGTDPTYEPFESEDAEGQIVGIDPDVMTAICEIANCQPVFQGTGWDGIFPALKAGEFDLLMSAITILPEREENSDATFTSPYFSIGQVILARADDETITGVESLPTAMVGVQNGTTGDTAATDAGVPEDQMRRFDTIPLAIQALLGGDVDLVVLDSTPAEKAVTTAEEGALRIVGEPFTSEDYGILVPDDSPELLAAFNHAIDLMRSSGDLDRIVAQWIEVEEADASEGEETADDAEDESEDAGADDESGDESSDEG